MRRKRREADHPDFDFFTQQGWGPPVAAVVWYGIESNMTALLWGETALPIPGYECNYLLIVTPSDFDRLVSVYRLTQTALYRLLVDSSGGGLCASPNKPILGKTKLFFFSFL